MRINLQGAEAARLDIDLSVNGQVRRVSLTGLHAVVGQLEQANSTARLHPLRADSVVLAALEWPLPGGGRLSVTSPAALAQLAIELDAAAQSDATSLTGRASAARAAADAVSVNWPAGERFAFDADLRQPSIAHTPERVGHAAADEVEVANLQAVLGGLLCRVSRVLFEQPRVDWQAGELLIGAGVARATALSIAIPAAGVTVEIDRAELPGGIRTSAGAIIIPELVVPETRIVVDDLVELFRPHRPAGAVAAAAPAFELAFLDRVSGRLDVDVTLDISVPVLGRRERTHPFRIPITSGVINYRELERDLANIEDAFIDIEVRGETLVIERAIPLIPGLEKPLVAWDLEPEELELARRRLVRLRTIPRLRLVPRGDRGERNEKSSVALRSLRFDNIDIAIALAPPPFGERDSISRASAGELRVTGRLAHEPNRTIEAAEVTPVSVSGSRLAAGPLAIRLGRDAREDAGNGGIAASSGGRARIEAESIELDALVDGSADFSGLRPRGATLCGRDLRIRNLRLVFPLP